MFAYKTVVKVCRAHIHFLRKLPKNRDLQPKFQQLKEQYVPLKKVDIKATIRSFAADVSITQVFRNDETTPIEAVYCFPIEEQAAVYSFLARIDDREIVAQLKDKKEAQKKYNEALHVGYGAYLLEQNEQSQDNFIINIGALPPGKECQVTISYVSELDLVKNGSTIRFVIPTTIAPRYDSDKGSISSPADTTSNYIQSSPYSVDFCCQIEKEGIANVSSTSHPIQVVLNNEKDYLITFAHPNIHLDRDILVDIALAEKRLTTAVVAEHGAMMATFTPTEKDCQRTMSQIETTNEFIFLVDCSASMEDEMKIGLTRQAMLLFLKSLPVHCKFNIVRFGSKHQALFNDVITAVYNEKNVAIAQQLINNMEADLGGTELLSPLQWLQENPPAQGRARQIFLLTDGEISNVDQAIDLCRAMAPSTRIFSFGLGYSPSRSLVKGLARATNGRFAFIPPNTSVDMYVGEQLEKALQPCITNVQVKWNCDTKAMISVPTKIPPVYANDRLIVYALVEDQSSIFNDYPSVELRTEQHLLGEVKITRMSNVSKNEMIARLAVKALILELQHSKLPLSAKQKSIGSLQTRFQESILSKDGNTTTEEMIKKHIIDLSLKYNILSPYTAFISIEKRMNASNIDMVLREVPIQISTDDQHLNMSKNPLNLYADSMSMQNKRQHYDPMMARSSEIRYMMLSNTINPTPVSYMLGIPLNKYSFRHDNTLVENKIEPDANGINQKVKQDIWSTDNEHIVHDLINKQKFDGSWDLDSKSIQQLSGKALSDFQHSTNNQVLISAIIIVVLETRFASFSKMWYGVVEKARKHLIDLLGKDEKKLDSLLEDIRKQL